jgi:hypothetical protein
MSIWVTGSKDVLYDHPAERERWFAFRDRRIYGRISRWLESEGIEPTNPKAPPEVPEPEADEGESREALLEELTLLVIHLSSWEEKLAPDLTVRRAWKGYLFEVLDALEEKGYISQTRRAKSVTLTEEGERWAEELAARYAIFWEEGEDQCLNCLKSPSLRGICGRSWSAGRSGASRCCSPSA